MRSPMISGKSEKTISKSEKQKQTSSKSGKEASGKPEKGKHNTGKKRKPDGEWRGREEEWQVR